MKEKKLIRSQKGRKAKMGRPSSSGFDPHFQRSVVKEYLEGDLSLEQLGKKYGVDRRRIFEWKQRYSNELPTAIPIISSMTEQEQKDYDSLRKQNEALKKHLEHARMKNFALETMIDLAKEKLGVDVRKNSGAKQPKE